MGTLNVPKPTSEVEDEIPLTVESLRQVVPRKAKAAITPKFVDHLNNLVEDPAARETFRENLIGFADILAEPNVSMKVYVQAIRYCSYKLMDMTNQDAWIRTFPERYQRMLDEGKGADAIRAAVSAYTKGKIVTQVMEQAMTPVWLLNRDVYQKAINTQALLMATAKSEKVRSDAANSLLTHLKPPEAKKVDITMGVKEDDSVKELRKAAIDLANAKREQIEAGMVTAKEVAEAKIIDVDHEAVD